MSKTFLLLGASLAGLSVIIGAFGAHALEPKLTAKALSHYNTAVQYQMFHSLALLIFALWLNQQTESAFLWVGWAFFLGILFFSGSLYALALSGIKILGAITPIGGLLFIAAWIGFCCAALKKQ